MGWNKFGVKLLVFLILGFVSEVMSIIAPLRIG